MAAARGTIQLARGSAKNVSQHHISRSANSRASSATISIVPVAALLAPPSLAASVNKAYSADALTMFTGIRSITADTCFSAAVSSSVSLAADAGEPLARDSRSVALLFLRQSSPLSALFHARSRRDSPNSLINCLCLKTMFLPRPSTKAPAASAAASSSTLVGF